MWKYDYSIGECQHVWVYVSEWMCCNSILNVTFFRHYQKWTVMTLESKKGILNFFNDGEKLYMQDYLKQSRWCSADRFLTVA